MNLKLSLFLTAALVVVVAASEGEAGKKLEAMRNHFLSWKNSRRAHPVRYSANSNAYASAGLANAASSAGATSAGTGGHRYGSHYGYAPAHETHHQMGYNSAPRRNTYGQGSVAATTASAGHGASSASGYASAGEPSHEYNAYGYEPVQHGHGYGHEHGHEHGHGHGHVHGHGHGHGHGQRHNYPAYSHEQVSHQSHNYPAYSHEQLASHQGHNKHAGHGKRNHGGRSRRGGHKQQHQQAYAEPEVAHETNYAQASSYSPVTSVHPPVPQVARDFYGGRLASDSGVSTSVAAAGSVAAAAAAAAASGSQGVSGVSFGSHSPSGSSAGAVSSGSHAGAHTAHSHQPVNQNDHVVETESSSEHYSKPESLDEFAASTGTLTNDKNGVVTSSYVRSTENEEEHEDGKENSDHHYKANSYGKTYDESHNEKFDRDDEDIIHTPQLFRKTKRVVNYNKDLNKARRESGSSVLAQDKHSASYNKDKKKFKENVNQNFHAEGQGVLETGSSNENSSADEESEEHYDSRNLAGGFVGVDGVKHDQRPMFNPAAAAAASASSAGVSSAASAGSR